jgi:hypothetical protein
VQSVPAGARGELPFMVKVSKCFFDLFRVLFEQSYHEYLWTYKDPPILGISTEM